MSRTIQRAYHLTSSITARNSPKSNSTQYGNICTTSPIKKRNQNIPHAPRKGFKAHVHFIDLEQVAVTNRPSSTQQNEKNLDFISPIKLFQAKTAETTLPIVPISDLGQVAYGETAIQQHERNKADFSSPIKVFQVTTATTTLPIVPFNVTARATKKNAFNKWYDDEKKKEKIQANCENPEDEKDGQEAPELRTTSNKYEEMVQQQQYLNQKKLNYIGLVNKLQHFLGDQNEFYDHRIKNIVFAHWLGSMKDTCYLKDASE